MNGLCASLPWQAAAGLLWLASGLAAADPAGPAPAPTAGFNPQVYIAGARTNLLLRLGRADCVAYALENNPDIKIRRIQPILRRDDVRIANADFDPTLTLSAILEDTTELSPNLIAGTNLSNTRLGDANANLGGKLWTGARYDLGVDFYRLKSSSPTALINPAFGLEPQLTLAQPLLRGAGVAYNRAEIVIARNNVQVSEQEFLHAAMGVIVRVLETYYALYYARAKYFIEFDTLERTRLLLQINQARYARGLLSSVDLLETEAAVAERRKRVISAFAAVENAEDVLKLVTYLAEDPALWNARLQLLDEPVFRLRRIELVESLERAFKHRPDYRAQTVALANRDIRIRLTRQDRLPTLDLVGSFGLNGLGESAGDAADHATLDYKDWMLGVRVTVPWGRGDRARYDKSRWEKTQALLELKRLEQEIICEVRNRVREVDIQRTQTEAALLAADMEQEHYDAQQERYAAGQVSTHDFLDYQNRLATARLDYVKALIDYQLSQVRLDQAEGMTLANNHISLETRHDP